MKLWIDDVRPAPNDGFYLTALSVNTAIELIQMIERRNARYAVHTYDGVTEDMEIELIDIDHDAGEYAYDGGDYIKLLDWLEETGRNYPIHIHSQNPVGRENMRRIIEKNGWKEIR